MNIIGAVIGKTQAEIALYDGEYKLLGKKAGKREDAVKLCLDMIAETGNVAYVGVAVDASVGASDAVAADMEKKLGVKCCGASLMSARALGEAHVAGVPSLFLIKIEDCVECGVVIDEQLYPGVHLRGGNVAHMVIHFGGFECACGNRGCFQAYASTSGLKRIAAEAGVEGAETITHAKLFSMNTPNAERAKELYVKYFAAGITNLVNLFQLDEFVLDGPFIEAGDLFMNPMMDIVLREQFTHDAPNKCTVRFSNQNADIALLGAALLGK